MASLPQRAAAELQHHEHPSLSKLSWDDIRVFLCCADAGSFRKAADTLRINSSTVVRRIERLEKMLGVPLFNRLPDGASPTSEGKAIVESARLMERAIFDVYRKTARPDADHRGTVRISITEGLGTYWMMPWLVDFQQQHQHMIVDLRCAMESADVLRMEADLAIQLSEPTAPDLVRFKLGRLHVYPFASKAYAERFGLPKNKEEMRHHRLVDQHAPPFAESAWAGYLGLANVEGIVGIRSNASSSIFYAIERGAGIGGLPTYACALNAPVVPVDIDVRHAKDIWLTYHPDLRKVKRVAVVIDWIKRIFDPVRYPWFRDEFIHPNELVKMAPPETEALSVRGFFAATPFRS
jgi:DNA-binding transcriptional LysR family regulator